MTASVGTWVMGALLVALGVTVGLQRVALADKDAAHAALGKQFSDFRGETERTAREASETNRREEARRNEDHRKIVDEAHSQRDSALADAAAAGSALARLRRRAADATRGGAAAGDSPVADGCAAAAKAAAVHDDVLAGVGEAAGQLAAYADAAVIAGQACQRAYEALTVPVDPFGVQTPAP